SSRRRHTRSKRDWSSDVCSSDLSSDKLPTLDQIPPGSYPLPDAEKAVFLFQGARFNVRELQEQMRRMGSMLPKQSALDGQEKRRSEERRVGQECRQRRKVDQL